MKTNTIHNGDCLELMKQIEDKTVDMILCDLPYGTTACSWDSIIDLTLLWKQYKRIIKDNGVIVLTGSQPFTSKLVMSNLKMFKYEWIWDKKRGTNFCNVKNAPMKEHENILIFSKSQNTYNPIKTLREGSRHKRNFNVEKVGEVYGTAKSSGNKVLSELRFPKSIISIPAEQNNQYKKVRFHPTQKPLALFKYLIKTYTNEGELVLDNCIGSGTTAVACKQLNRNFIGIEINQEYVDITNRRLQQDTI